MPLCSIHYRDFPEIKKEKERNRERKQHNTFPPMGSFQNTYRGDKKYIVVHCIDVNRTVCFHPGVMSEQCRASFTVPAHWNERPIQRETLGWSQFLGVFMHGHTSF